LRECVAKNQAIWNNPKLVEIEQHRKFSSLKKTLKKKVKKAGKDIQIFAIMRIA